MKELNGAERMISVLDGVQKTFCGKRKVLYQPFPKQTLVFMCLQYKSFKNPVGKGEIACYDQFLLFPQCFLPVWKAFYHFHQILNCRLQSLSIWKSLKFIDWERVKVPIAANKKDVHLQNTSKSHSYHLKLWPLFWFYW